MFGGRRAIIASCWLDIRRSFSADASKSLLPRFGVLRDSIRPLSQSFRAVRQKSIGCRDRRENKLLWQGPKGDLGELYWFGSVRRLILLPPMFGTPPHQLCSPSDRQEAKRILACLDVVFVGKGVPSDSVK